MKTPQPEAAEHFQDDGGVERRQGEKLSFRSENSIGNDRAGVRIPISRIGAKRLQGDDTAGADIGTLKQRLEGF